MTFIRYRVRRRHHDDAAISTSCSHENTVVVNLSSSQISEYFLTLQDRVVEFDVGGNSILRSHRRTVELWMPTLLESVAFHKQSLQALNLQNAKMGIPGIMLLSDTLDGTFTALQELNLNGNELGSIGTAPLSDAVSLLTGLKRLKLGSNFIGNSGLHSLVVNALVKMECLEELDLSNNAFTLDTKNDITGCALALLFRVCGKTLKKVHLDHNFMGSSSQHTTGTVLAQSLFSSDSAMLTELHLGHIGLGAVGTSVLAKSLANNPLKCLEILHLPCNGMGNAGAVNLVTALYSNSTLVELNLADNGIGDDGASAIAGLISSGLLQRLDLSLNRIGKLGAMEIFDALEVSSNSDSVTRMTFLKMDHRHMGMQWHHRIQRLLVPGSSNRVNNATTAALPVCVPVEEDGTVRVHFVECGEEDVVLLESCSCTSCTMCVPVEESGTVRIHFVENLEEEDVVLLESCSCTSCTLPFAVCAPALLPTEREAFLTRYKTQVNQGPEIVVASTSVEPSAPPLVAVQNFGNDTILSPPLSNTLQQIPLAQSLPLTTPLYSTELPTI